MSIKERMKDVFRSSAKTNHTTVKEDSINLAQQWDRQAVAAHINLIRTHRVYIQKGTDEALDAFEEANEVYGTFTGSSNPWR